MRARCEWRKVIRWARAMFVLGLWGYGVACGTTSNPSVSSPPLDIPIPISNLITVSGPDANGDVRVTGAPGAVLNGALVRVANLNQGGMAFRFSDLLLASAWAQNSATVEVVANADGSFQLVLKGQIGDTLRVVQIIAGEKSPPVDLIVTGKNVLLEIIPKALGISTALGRAFITGAQGEEGQVLSLELVPLPGSFPELIFQLPNFSGITEFTLAEELGLGLAISPSDGGLYRLVLDHSEPPLLTALPTPLSLAIEPEKQVAVIGSGGVPSILLYDIVANLITCSIDLPHPINPDLQTLRIPELVLVTPAQGPQLRLIALSQFTDQSWLLRKIRINANNCEHFEILDINLPELQQPGDLVVDSRETTAWLSDTGGDRVFRIDLETSQVNAIEVGSSPLGLALSEDLGTLWVVNQGENSISAVNTTDFSTRLRTEIGMAPSYIAIDAEQARALVLSTLDQSLVLVDLDF